MESVTERRRFWAVVIGVLVLDLSTKIAAEALLPRWVGVSVIGEFFQLRLVYNPGAAFGIHVGPWSRWVFMALSAAALVILWSMLNGTRPGDRVRHYAIALVFAGAAGNLIDRIRSPRGVVDFLDFTFGNFHFPTFNVADSAVTCGAVLLALSLWADGRAPQAHGAPADGRSPAPPPQVRSPAPPQTG
jgi:signal peptidase II